MGQQIEARSGVNDSSESWATRATLGFERWMASYIRPYDPEKEARRHRLLIAEARAIGLAVALLIVGPWVSPRVTPHVIDGLRDQGVLDATTPITLGFNPPNRTLTTELGGSRLVDLSNPHDLAVGGRGTVSNATPGLGLRINLDVLEEVTTNPAYNIDIPENNLVHSLVLPLSTTNERTLQELIFLNNEALRVATFSDLDNIAKRQHIEYIYADEEVSRLNRLGLVPKSEPKPMVGLPLIAILGGPSLEQQISVVLSEKWLNGIVKFSNMFPKQIPLDVDNISKQFEKLIKEEALPIQVTHFDKRMFDSRNKKRVFPTPTPFPTPIPSPTPSLQFSLDEAQKCFITIQGVSSNTPPAEVEFAMGAIINKSGNLYITAVQWDFDGDGRWDTAMGQDQHIPQKRLYTQLGRNTIGGQIQISDGTTSKPCFTSFVLVGN